MTKLIVELCQNHLGDRDRLSRLLDAAAASGADYVKIQSIFSDDLTMRDQFEEGASSADGQVLAIKRPFAAEKARLSKLNLTIDDHYWFIERCQALGVTPMTTIFSRHRIPTIGSLPWPERIIKVASYDCASWPMLEELARYFDRFIISTGASFDDEIAVTAGLMKQLRKDHTFLHCVTSYPNTIEMCHLSRMNWLRMLSTEVGWSDHTLVSRDGIKASLVAIMLGADWIERHFTLSANDETKDAPVSINPDQLRELDRFRRFSKEQQTEYVNREIPNWQHFLGEPQRSMTSAERLNRDYYRGRFASPSGGGTWLNNWEPGGSGVRTDS